MEIDAQALIDRYGDRGQPVRPAVRNRWGIRSGACGHIALDSRVDPEIAIKGFPVGFIMFENLEMDGLPVMSEMEAEICQVCGVERTSATSSTNIVKVIGQ